MATTIPSHFGFQLKACWHEFVMTDVIAVAPASVHMLATVKRSLGKVCSKILIANFR
jgi:hypothetical protein